MEEVLVERPQAEVALIRLNRPEARNALSQSLRQALTAHFVTLSEDDSVRCIVLTGGERVFAAGADLRAMADSSPIDILLLNNQRMWQTIAACPKPVIAAVSLSPKKYTSRVYSSSAGISEAIRFSPSPMPITSGLSFLAATINPGCFCDTTPRAYEPSSLGSAFNTAASRSPS